MKYFSQVNDLYKSRNKKFELTLICWRKSQLIEFKGILEKEKNEFGIQF